MRTPRFLLVPFTVGTLALLGCQESTAPGSPTAPPSAELGVAMVPGDFPTIQAAIDAASPGDIVFVEPGVYAERVVIATSGIRLRSRGRGDGVVLDGVPLGGTGIGIHVLGASAASPVTGVEIMGFEVRNFERGIVLEWAEGSRVHLNEVHGNTDKNPADGAFNLADGIVLNASNGNEVTQNHVHDNGHNGIFLIGGSSGNTVRGNRSHDNGAQTGALSAGCGIQLTGAANDDNLLVENEILRNGWGILLGPAGAASENRVAQNRVHQNRRAGISLFAEAFGNSVLQNNATGNGLLNLAPSGTVDLFDASVPPDNVWARNQGTSNF